MNSGPAPVAVSVQDVPGDVYMAAEQEGGETEERKGVTGREIPKAQEIPKQGLLSQGVEKWNFVPGIVSYMCAFPLMCINCARSLL